MATSAYFDRMFYYAVGNKIYRADLTRSTPRSYEIYAHPDPSVRITRLKFRSQREDRWDISGVSYLGGVAEYPDGNCSMLEMKLTAAGEIDKEEGTKDLMVYEFKGFKNVVDFVYAFK